MKIRLWALAVAMSLCLTGLASCDKTQTNDPATQAAGQTAKKEAVAPQADGRSPDPVASSDASQIGSEKYLSSDDVTRLTQAYKAYLTSTDDELVALFNASPQQLQASLITVSQQLQELQDSIKQKEPWPTLTQLKEESELQSDSNGASILQSLNDIDMAAGKIQLKIVDPLKNSLPNDSDILAYSNDTIRSIQTSVGIVEADGKYDEGTAESIQRYVTAQNSAIAEALQRLTALADIEAGTMPPNDPNPSASITPPPVTPDSATPNYRNSRGNRGDIAWLAGFIGLVLGGGIGFAASYLLKQFRYRNEVERFARSKYDGKEYTEGNNPGINRAKLLKLEAERDKLKRQIKGLEKTMKGQADQLLSISETHVANEVADAEVERRVREILRAREIDHQDDQPASPPLSQSKADIYNESRSAFDQVDAVELSKQSQEELWVGKDVTPVFFSSKRGDYWIVTADKREYFVVLKDDAIINSNSLKTLDIIYRFLQQPNLQALQRSYQKLARVNRHSNGGWILAESGELDFHN